MDLKCTISEESAVKSMNYMQFLSDTLIVKIAAAIFISTIGIATLEPCLPIWLMANLKPEVSLRIELQWKKCSFIFHFSFHLFRNGKLERFSYPIPLVIL